jgi:hypothetical protein
LEAALDALRRDVVKDGCIGEAIPGAGMMARFEAFVNATAQAYSVDTEDLELEYEHKHGDMPSMTLGITEG